MKKKIIVVAGALVAVVGAGAGVWFYAPELLPGFIVPKQETPAKEGKGAEKKHEPEVSVDLDTFVVNLAGSGVGRYFRTSLSLGVKSEHEKEEIKSFIAPVRHAVIMYLTSRTVEELIQPEGKRKVQEEIRKLVNGAIGKNIVQNVYFKEFLIQ